MPCFFRDSVCWCLGIHPRGQSGFVVRQRFREMFRQAQHDGAEGVIPSEAEESRGNERGGWFLIFAFP